MKQTRLVKMLMRHGNMTAVARELCQQKGIPYDEDQLHKLASSFIRLRIRHDFPFWAALTVYIRKKGGGSDVRFVLTRPQRRFVERLERLRLANRPIRIILLKARQWGGSTTSQIYMAWLQLVHVKGLNSVIIAHQQYGSDNIKEMFKKMLDRYPAELLHELGESYAPNEAKLVGVGKSGLTHKVPQRNCTISIGSAKNPDSCRSGDYSLAHFSEVAYFETTDNKKPEDLVRSATSGILYKPNTMIVYESTANGTGNFFQTEYDAAKTGTSQFEAMFVSWYDIELYTLPITSNTLPKAITPSAAAPEHDFAEWLYTNRDNADVRSDREEPGKFLWHLWQQGATLEALNWYIHERAKYHDHADIAAEFPSNDVEAFKHSGTRVFDEFKVERLRTSCRPPKFVGDIYATFDEGEQALKDVRFTEDHQGQLWIWAKPQTDNTETITDRYITVVDIGGRSNKADFSVILVIDRLNLAFGENQTVVAQWYGHIDMDILAWKAAQIATYYDNSLLVIESNTLETHDTNRQVDGDQSQFILNQIRNVYPNLYARRQSEDEIREKKPKKYGFHTNISTKPMIISTLVKVVRENLYTERDTRCCDEYLTYERKTNGAYGAISGKHDDLLMTRAIALHISLFEMPIPKIIPQQPTTPHHKSRTISAATI